VSSTSDGFLRRPTRVRWAIMACIALVTMLTYLDRLNLGIAGKYIQDEFALSTPAMGWIFSAFLLGYAIFQVPGGWAGDRYGPKNVLTIAILMWSLFTALTGLAPNLAFGHWFGVVAAFLVVRFVVGAGEAANSPNAAKIVSSWMGMEHRGIGSSFTILGIGIGGAMTPPLIAWVMQHFGWRSSFYFSGLLGLLVVLFWEWYVTNTPEEHTGVNSDELALIHAGRQPKQKKVSERMRPPWAKMLSSASVWGLVLGYFCQGYPIYFFHTWFFIYLIRVRHLSIRQGGVWGAAPYLAIVLLAPVGGLFSDFAVQKLGKRAGRIVAVCVGMVPSAVLLWVGSAMASSTAAILLLAVGAGLNMFAATTFWAACIDLTEDFTGSLSGLMNTSGNLGGWLSPILTAYIATHVSWNRALDCAAVVSLLSAVFFLAVNADKSLDAQAPLSPSVLSKQKALGSDKVASRR
jgi:MFS transporter, ACS family, glucarate transporter